MTDTATRTVLSIRGLTVELPVDAERAHAVEDVSFDVQAGEIVCLVGESGSGKSVTAQAVLGLLPPGQLRVTGGAIELEGEDLRTAPPARLRSLRGRAMAMIFQEPMTALNPVLTVGEQVREVFETHGVLNPSERRERVIELFRSVQLPDPERLVNTYPHQLSGGQRQRVMIAMAFALEPALLVADEPTTALDVTTQARILEIMRTIQRARGSAVLFITHDFGVVADIADRVVVMRTGRVVEQGPRDQILRSPSHPYTRMLLEAVPGLEPEARDGRAESAALEVRNLSKTFAGGGWFQRGRTVEAVRDVSLVVRKGETLAVVGESGSGKSTLARCTVRLTRASSGEVLLAGEDIAQLEPRALRPFRRRIQMVFQDPFRSLNPRRNVAAALIEGPVNYGVSREEALERAKRLLGLVGLGDDALGRYPHQFSGGQRQRICIARALALEPDVLIADEPVSALDVSVQAQVLDLLADVRERFQLAMLFITHDLRVAAQVADRVAVMSKGEIVETGPVADVFGNPRHPYSRALLAAAPGRGRL